MTERFLAPMGVASYYLSRDDVQRLAHYGHFIPIGRGWTREFMAKNYPGWSWGGMMQAIRDAGLYRPNDGHGGKLAEGYTGVLVSASGVIADDGRLDHPVKHTWRPENRTH